MPPTAPDLELSSTSRASSGYNDLWLTARVGDWGPDFALVMPFDAIINSQLAQLAALKSNWDSEGASPIDPQIVEAAQELVCRLPRSIKDKSNVPAVVPMRKGNLQFEWHYGPRTLELEIEDPRIIHYLKWHPEAGIEEEKVCSIKETRTIVGLIEWVVKG